MRDDIVEVEGAFYAESGIEVEHGGEIWTDLCPCDDVGNEIDEDEFVTAHLAIIQGVRIFNLNAYDALHAVDQDAVQQLLEAMHRAREDEEEDDDDEDDWFGEE